MIVRPSSPHKILVAGGSGFLGSVVVAQLARQGYEVIVPTRRLTHAMHLRLLPRVEVVEGDLLTDHSLLESLLEKCSVVINLIGILHGPGAKATGRSYSKAFSQVFVQWPETLIHALGNQRKASVEHLIHISAIGASPQGASQYLRARADGEAIIRQGCKQWGIAQTILRPSLIVAENAPFVQMFNTMVRYLPILFIPNPEFSFQPIAVGDVAQVVEKSVLAPVAYGETFELVGHEVMTMAEWVHYLAFLANKTRIVLALPKPLAILLATAMELLPNPPMSRDNLAGMAAPSTSSQTLPFGIVAKTLHQALNHDTQLARLSAMRASARRLKA